MDERYIIAPAALKAELFGAELNAVSAHGLLEHVLEPMIHCRTCEGILEEYAKETGGDLDKAAREWMEENFDALGAALFAVEQLVSLTADTLQMLPVVQTKGEDSACRPAPFRGCIRLHRKRNLRCSVVACRP